MCEAETSAAGGDLLHNPDYVKLVPAVRCESPTFELPGEAVACRLSSSPSTITRSLSPLTPERLKNAVFLSRPLVFIYLGVSLPVYPVCYVSHIFVSLVNLYTLF